MDPEVMTNSIDCFIIFVAKVLSKGAADMK